MQSVLFHLNGTRTTSNNNVRGGSISSFFFYLLFSLVSLVSTKSPINLKYYSGICQKYAANLLLLSDI